MLYLVGLGLADEKDVTVKGLEVIKRAHRIYLESYTSLLLVPKEKLEAYYEKSIIIADREMVETFADEILKDADTLDVVFLVVGDPFGATTHSDLVLRARAKGISVETIHNASIMNACGCSGLQLYTFGQTVSLVFFTPTWRPDSAYDKILVNRRNGFHTLCLLDIKVKEPNYDNLIKTGKISYDPPRFMTISQAIDQLLEMEDKRQLSCYQKDTLCVGLSRVGANNQRIICGTMEELRNADFGAPLHSLIIIGKMHELERDLVRYYCHNQASFNTSYEIYHK